MKVTIKYKLGHSSEEEFEKCGLFCPSCGKQEVWQEQGMGDYYVGQEYICIACDSSFTIQGPFTISDSSSEATHQILAALKEGQS